MQDPAVKEAFVTAFNRALGPHTCSSEYDVEKVVENIQVAFENAAEVALPVCTAMPARPWISSTTIMLIDERNTARTTANRQLELAFNRKMKNSSKRDRVQCMERAGQDGDWKSIQKAYKATPPPQG